MQAPGSEVVQWTDKCQCVGQVATLTHPQTPLFKCGLGSTGCTTDCTQANTQKPRVHWWVLMIFFLFFFAVKLCSQTKLFYIEIREQGTFTQCIYESICLSTYYLLVVYTEGKLTNM